MKYKVLIEMDTKHEWRIVSRACTERGFSSWGFAVLRDGYISLKDAQKDYVTVQRRRDRERRRNLMAQTYPEPGGRR